MKSSIFDEFLRRQAEANPFRQFQSEQQPAPRFCAQPKKEETPEAEKWVRGFLAMIRADGWQVRVIRRHDNVELRGEWIFEWRDVRGAVVRGRVIQRDLLQLTKPLEIIATAFFQLAESQGWRAWVNGFEQLRKAA